MNIDESRALVIAREFAEREYKEDKPLRVRLGKSHARFETGGLGKTLLGLSENYWSVLFELEVLDPDVAVINPDHVIVLVDVESGAPVWFPIM